MARPTLMLAILLILLVPAASFGIDFTPLDTCSPSGSSFHCLYDEASLSPDQRR